jgi:adenylate cyclase class IV
MKLNHSSLYKYILENHCFDEGIITIDFIKKYGCFLESEIDDPDSSESSSNSQSSTSSNSLYYSHESDIQPE